MSHDHNTERKLLVAFGITLLVMVAEVIAGYMSNSLALLSDAGHMLTDALALGLSLVAARVGRLPLGGRATYGYNRVPLLAAAVNGASLIAVAGFILHEAYGRFMSPPQVDLQVMMPIAALGLLANLAMIRVLGHGAHELNLKSAWLHVLGDTLSSVGVLVSGAVLYFTGWQYADPLAGVLISIIIVVGGMRVLMESVYIFLDFAPITKDVGQIADSIRAVDKVMGVHDVHLRSQSYGRLHFTAHVYIEDCLISQTAPIRAEIEQILKQLGVVHMLIQFESVQCRDGGLYCTSCAEGERLVDDKHLHGGH